MSITGFVLYNPNSRARRVLQHKTPVPQIARLSDIPNIARRESKSDETFIDEPPINMRLELWINGSYIAPLPLRNQTLVQLMKMSIGAGLSELLAKGEREFKLAVNQVTGVRYKTAEVGGRYRMDNTLQIDTESVIGGYSSRFVLAPPVKSFLWQRIRRGQYMKMTAILELSPFGLGRVESLVAVREEEARGR